MSTISIPWPSESEWRRLAWRAALVVLTIYVLYVVREIWLPLALAFLIAMVLDPVVDRMEQRGWSRGAATVFIFLSFILIVGGLIVLSAPVVIHQVEAMRSQFGRYFPDSSHQGLEQAFTRLNVPSGLVSVAVQAYEGLRSGLDRSSQWLVNNGMSFLSNLIWVVIVPIVAFYALRDFHLILGKALLLVPKRRRDLVETYVAEVTAVFARYLRGLAIVSAMNGAATWILLWLLGVPSALILGIMAGVLYTVPYIGALMTIVLTAAVAFVGVGLKTMMIAVALSVLLHQIVFDQIISPRILGGQVGLHPILAIVALLAGNLLLGIAGMVLAVPVAACIQIGVLALVPKLAVEIDFPKPEAGAEKSAAVLGEETKQKQLASDENAELHQSVAEAVSEVERQAQAPGNA